MRIVVTRTINKRAGKIQSRVISRNVRCEEKFQRSVAGKKALIFTLMNYLFLVFGNLYTIMH